MSVPLFLLVHKQGVSPLRHTGLSSPSTAAPYRVLSQKQALGPPVCPGCGAFPMHWLICLVGKGCKLPCWYGDQSTRRGLNPSGHTVSSGIQYAGKQKELQ